MNLKQYIADVVDFPKPGIIFRDITPLLANFSAFAYAIETVASAWREKVDVVVALDARGFLFGAPVALALGVPFVPVRKKGKLPGETVQYTYDLEYGTDIVELKKGVLAPGARVLVIDDLLATGGTASAACALVGSVGARVIGCAFVIELQSLKGRLRLSKVPIQTLVTYEEMS